MAPTSTRPGTTKMIEERVPMAEAMVWTMLFSCTVLPPSACSGAMEVTAAGNEEAKVRLTRRPR